MRWLTAGMLQTRRPAWAREVGAVHVRNQRRFGIGTEARCVAQPRQYAFGASTAVSDVSCCDI